MQGSVQGLPVMLDAFQSVLACSVAIAEPRRHARDWNCCLVVLSPMKMRRLPLRHWLKAGASQGLRLQVWGWKTCMADEASHKFPVDIDTSSSNRGHTSQAERLKTE